MSVTVAALLLVTLAPLVLLAGFTRVNTWLIGFRNPPAGSFANVGGVSLHHVHVSAQDSDLPPVVFIHGASANLNDQLAPMQPLLQGRAEMLFLDRPGLGWSGRAKGHVSQYEQAALIAGLMDRLGIGPAIIVGHSFGGSIAAAFALDFPEKTKGLLFLSAATHPWPGGKTSWYYSVTRIPVIGWLFSETVVGLAGLIQMRGATKCVFAPNMMPEDYLRRAQIPLVLRPRAFRANAADVEGLYRFALENASRYPEIIAPAVVISGDADTVVYEEIHSIGLVRDIPDAELVWVRNLGHKPDWITPDLAVAAIEKLAGLPRDLQAMARAVEARIADDRFSPGCEPTSVPDRELAGI
ncbi:MAG: alpha/beta hydrolase [Mesorhizobium sp.]|nr:alpha/beta hydrolase [Mesorhizobium sp.]MBL8576622.1 alpha/beta hydrolase [Mesorhizobium sp.]